MKRIKNSKTGIIVTAAIATFAFAGCGSSSSATSTPMSSNSTISSNSVPQQDAGDFVKQYVERAVLGQWGPQWDTLHPAEQKIVSRSAYMACRQEDSIPQIDNIKVVEEYKEPLAIPGVGNVPSTAVTMKLTGNGVDESMTAHAIAVNGSWRWITSPEQLAAYKSGNCP